MCGGNRHGLLALLVGAVLATGGCAATMDDPAVSSAFPSSEVVVENNKWLDVNVYAVRAGRRMRLGTVTSMTSQSFRLPSWATTGSGDLRLLIDPIGSSSTHLTGPIPIVGGERVEMRVENAMELSAYSVRSRR